MSELQSLGESLNKFAVAIDAASKRYLEASELLAAVLSEEPPASPEPKAAAKPEPKAAAKKPESKKPESKKAKPKADDFDLGDGEEESPEPEVDPQEMQRALVAYSKAHGREALIEKIDQVQKGARSFGQLKEENYAELIEVLEAA